MSTRLRVVAGMVLGGVVCTSAGCWDEMNAGPLPYVEAEALTRDLKGKPNLAGRPKLQARVREALARLFGDSLQHIRVPEGMGLPGGGIYLANHVQEREGAKVKRIFYARSDGSPDYAHPQEGGYAIYRRFCLHCHGASGGGDGPTAPFLFPIPRDFRQGIFKFTSTPSGKPPHRDDLHRTVAEGLPGTSMPAFKAQLSAGQIEQVVDYVMFLSMRGEVEQVLIEEAAIAAENDSGALSDELIKQVAAGVFNKWKQSQNQRMNPRTPRTPSTRESVLRGRDLFLGRTREKLDCTTCHGMLARGDGPGFPSQEVFSKVVFGGSPGELELRLSKLDEGTRKQWKEKLDDWGHPLRPADLNRGDYKGGRRPIDLFWRIAQGINGAQMPARYPGLSEQQIWDLVNFVLALPYEPELLSEVVGQPGEAELAHRAATR